MADQQRHSRRDFLKGRAAVRTVTGAAQAWVDPKLHSSSGPWDLSTSQKNEAMHHCASHRAMACEFEVQYHAADAELATDVVLSAFDLIEQLESQLTIYREHSEVITINQSAASGPVKVETRLFALLEQAAQLHRETQGALDITSGPLSRVWGFLQRQGRLPREQEIDDALQRVGFERVILDAKQQTIRFQDKAVEINLNAIGKGYALDRAAEVLTEAGLTDYLWHGGRSSVLARGRNRADQRQAWSVGLRHPLRPECQLAEFFLRDRALATTGGGTQFFEQDGKRFGHVLDPRTGQPAEGVFTATVLAPTAAEADALSTAFFVMGTAEVAEYCVAHPEIGAVLVCAGNQEIEQSDEISNEGTITLHAFGLGDEDWCRIG